jgi:uncharacterized glyoxalase superfamily protein PhnB
MAKPIPDGYYTVTPHLVIKDAAKALEFYKTAFGAEEMFRMPGPGGTVMHAEMKIGNSHVMVNDEMPDYGALAPTSIGGTPVTLHLYVNDVDSFFKKAIQAGAKEEMAVADMFWGDRYGKLVDPFGHKWSVATHKEDVSPEECARRMEKEFGGKC